MLDLARSLHIQVPIIQAPMAGGPDSAALAAAVSNAGGLGSVGCGYLSAAQIEALASELRQRTAKPFAINLFVRSDAPDDPAAEARVTPCLRTFARELGLPEALELGPPAPAFEPQLEAVLRVKPAVFSFTFGILTRDQLAALRERGIAVVGTATHVAEADALAELGVDAICAQGSEAGGHRGTFVGTYDDALIGTMALVPQLVHRTALPVIAAGGIMDGNGIRAALQLGASAVQLGTAFMTCPEAGTLPVHRQALASQGQHTTITRAFSGRAARGIRNRMTVAFETLEAAPFPHQQRLTAKIRAAAAKAGNTAIMQLWAGQGAPLARDLPAGDLVHTLAAEAGLVPQN
jgi:nitronate monooxygenase